MKKLILSLGVLTALVSCNSNDSVDIKKQEQEQKQQELLSTAQINTIIEKSIKDSGDFIWSDQNAHVIWSALSYSENLLTIGYGSSKEHIERGRNSQNIKNQLLSLINNEEKRSVQKSQGFHANEDINVMDVKISKKETLEILLKDSRVRYIEPANYIFNKANGRGVSSAKGCGYSQSSLNRNDYRTVTPGARVPWTFDRHKIPQAWQYSTGKGITVAIVDTGLSPDQKWLNQYFNDGHSSGRTVQKYGTFVDSIFPWSDNYDGVDDKCGHGTSMAAVATAPRNNDNLPVGVAYNANLVSYRAVENVVINDYHEKRGVSEALTALGKRSDVKVISMSIGYPFSIGKVKDAVKFAYNKGKMIIAAGGTSTSFTSWVGVIFPASMKETVAVTGVKEGNNYDTCDICHNGKEIDFTIQMQRSNSTKNKIPVLSYYNGKEDYEGGSSIATATTAGIAALVWAKNPNWTRDQVLLKMKKASDFYPTKNAKYGHGNINALKAVQ